MRYPIMLTAVNDVAQISFFRRIFDPAVIAGTLYVSALLFDERFSGHLLVLTLVAVFISSIVYQHIDPYRPWRRGQMWSYTRDTVFGWLFTIALLMFVGSSSEIRHYYNERLLLAWAIATPLILLGSHIAVLLAIRRGESAKARSVVIVGVNDVSLKFARICDSDANLFMQVRGFFDDRDNTRNGTSLPHPILGKTGALAQYVRSNCIKMIFISQPMSSHPRIYNFMNDLQDTTASVYFLPNVYVFDVIQARFDSMGGMPVIAIRESPFMGLNSAIKRSSDIIFASVILFLLTPLLLATAVAVKASSPGPVFFRQRRYGLYGEEIVVYKFRSMNVMEDGSTILQARRSDERLTCIGGFLRRSSLDELPQLVNVLQGRMSIVGPRPHAVAHNEQYRKLIKGYMLRHKVKPGITGWAQVNGLRGETATLDKMEARVRFDLDYLCNWSIWLDIWIIIKTVQVVFSRKNAF